ncbi:hypothetical protein [Roseibium sp. SCP14]|uniref:hypothetical protein n=1 Tax=Roseibium sp. SCP14 TaxID=3141375 RepID=UPI0033391AF8
MSDVEHKAETEASGLVANNRADRVYPVSDSFFELDVPEPNAAGPGYAGDAGIRCP